MKKLLTTFLAVVGLFLATSGLAKAEFVPYQEPSIKNDYCGPVMNYKYCKCAFHGQHCDAVGMDSAGANNYVQSGFTNWANEKRVQFGAVCNEQGGIQKTIDGQFGCLYCDPPSFKYEGDCWTVEELCSDDPNIKFSVEDDACYCPTGYELLTDNTCEPICPPDDPSLVYDPEIDECVCAPGYEEGDDGFCVEAPEINLNVEFIDSTPPFLADGETQGVMEISITDYETGDPVEARFAIKYSDTGKPGRVVSSEMIEPGKYKIVYQTANLKEMGKSGVFDDGLYIFYDSKRQEEEVYKVQPIQVAVGLISQVVFTKPGFEQTPTEIVFTSPQTKIHFITEYEGQTYDIAGATVEIVSNYASFTSDSSGMVTVEAPQNMESEIDNEMEVVLPLTAEAKDDVADAGRNLKKVRGVTASGMENTSALINDFVGKLCQTKTADEAETLLSGVKRVKYALFFILEGEKNLKLTTKGMADAIKDQIWDLMDMADVFGKLADKFGGPIKRFVEGVGEKAGDLTVDAVKPLLKDMGEWGEYFAKGIEMEGWGFYNEMRVLNTKVANMGQDLISQFAAAMRYFTQASAPNFDAGWVNEFTWEMTKKASIDHGVKEGYNAVKSEDWIQEFFLSREREMLTALADQIDAKVARGNWNRIHTDTDLLTAKWDYDKMMSKYRLAAGTDVRITEAKAEIELLLDVVLTPLKFTGFAWEAAEAAETTYKVARSAVLNNHVFFSWADATGLVNQKMMTAVDRALGMPSQSSSIWPLAIAQEETAEGGLVVDEQFIDYGKAATEADYLKNLYEITSTIEKYFPDETGELKSYNEGLEERIATAEAQRDELKPLVKKDLEAVGETEDETGEPTSECDDPLDVNCDGKVDLKDITVGEWLALGVMVIILYFIVKGIRRLFNRKKK